MIAHKLRHRVRCSTGGGFCHPRWPSRIRPKPVPLHCCYANSARNGMLSIGLSIPLLESQLPCLQGFSWRSSLVSREGPVTQSPSHAVSETRPSGEAPQEVEPQTWDSEGCEEKNHVAYRSLLDSNSSERGCQAPGTTGSSNLSFSATFSVGLTSE